MFCASDSKCSPIPPRPTCGKFASGPTRKITRPRLDGAVLGISHRSPQGLALIQHALTLLREVLHIPDTHKLALMSGGGSAAVEFLLWNLLGPRPVDVFSEGVFGDHWEQDVRTELHLPGQTIRSPIGTPVDFSSHCPEHDSVLTWNETPSGTQLTPDIAPLNCLSKGLILCDAVASVFCTPLPWNKLDAIGFSWQKGIGGEPGLGTVVLGPRAIERLETYRPAWGRPRLFRPPFLHKSETLGRRSIDPKFFEGCTINTVSLMVVADMVFALEWSQRQGGLASLLERVERNDALVRKWVASRDDITFLVRDEYRRAHHVACLMVYDRAGHPADWVFLQRLAAFLEKTAGIVGILNHAQSVPSLRIWLGPVVEEEDIRHLLLWLERALNQVKEGTA